MVHCTSMRGKVLGIEALWTEKLEAATNTMLAASAALGRAQLRLGSSRQSSDDHIGAPNSATHKNV